MGFTTAEPILITAGAPGGEIDVIDGEAFELLCEDGLDLWQGIEPGEDGGGFEAVAKFLVELFAD
jgi:hypothetical protein